MDKGPLKKNIAVLAGGYSDEAVISIQSATTVIENLDRDLFNPILVRIDKDRWWVDVDGSPSIDKETFTYSGGKSFDAVFIMVHGTPGEDGILQKYFEELHLPFTTGSSESVSGTFNKFKTTSKLRDAGFKVGDSIIIDAKRAVKQSDLDLFLSTVSLPCFVKPNQGGSSLGISKVKIAEELNSALQSARSTGCPSIIIESLLEGREFSMGIIPSKNGTPVAMPITEIVSENEFFDYQAKYEGASEEITPAYLEENVRKAISDAGVKAYELLGCKGMVRIDYILVDGRCPAILEVNAVPGFSRMSILPQQLECAGIQIKEMLSRVLNQSMK